MKQAAVLGIVFLCLAGCSSRLVTNTSRSAIEQMLLTGAVDKAMAKFSLAEVEGVKVFLDFSNLAAVDAPYVKTAARARFCELGATLVDKAGEADLIAEIACGALGTEFKTTVVGLPPLPVPNSPIPLPEASLYKSSDRTGIVKILIFVHAKGRFVAANQYYAKADRNESFIFWWRFQRQDDVREGWERADLKLAKQALQSQNGHE